MEATDATEVVVAVDPCCPFAWITFRWLTELERRPSVRLRVQLLSLAVVNEHRELDPWYRVFNDQAWGPARVMAAVNDRHGASAARRFYEAFGERFHVQLGSGDDVDRRTVAARALADAGLPQILIDAADDACWDAPLRAITTEMLDRVGLEVGVPIVVIDGVATSGPVMTTIPRGHDATRLYDAVRTLIAQPGFVRLERQRMGALEVA